MLFPAFAAVFFFGATQFNCRPNVWGTFPAIVTLALGVQGLQLSLDSDGFWITPMFNGLALIFAVVLSGRRHTRSDTARDGEPYRAAPSGE